MQFLDKMRSNVDVGCFNRSGCQPHFLIFASQRQREPKTTEINDIFHSSEGICELGLCVVGLAEAKNVFTQCQNHKKCFKR